MIKLAKQFPLILAVVVIIIGLFSCETDRTSLKFYGSIYSMPAPSVNGFYLRAGSSCGCGGRVSCSTFHREVGEYLSYHPELQVKELLSYQREDGVDCKDSILVEHVAGPTGQPIQPVQKVVQTTNIVVDKLWIVVGVSVVALMAIFQTVMLLWKKRK